MVGLFSILTTSQKFAVLLVRKHSGIFPVLLVFQPQISSFS